MKWLFVLIAIGVAMFIIASIGAGGLAGLGSPKGDVPSDSSTALTPGEAGPISGRVPAPLAALFAEPAAAGIPVPAALLAAVSFQECGGLWQVDEATLKTWIDSNEVILDRRACGYRNNEESRAWGPMQFTEGTFFGRNLGGSIGGANRPVPNSNTYGARVAQFIKHPAPASPIIIRDAIFSGALKLHNDSAGLRRRGTRVERPTKGVAIEQDPAGWSETHAKNALGAYAGACDGNHRFGGGRRVRVAYCDQVIANWRRFSQAGL